MSGAGRRRLIALAAAFTASPAAAQAVKVEMVGEKGTFQLLRGGGLLPRRGVPVGGCAGRHGNDAKAAKRWTEKLCRLLGEGRMDDVLAALRHPGTQRGWKDV